MLLLSWLLLGAKYRPAHVAGALLAIVGSSILVLSDSRGGVGDGPRPLLGDGLVLIGAAIYAMLNIAEERLLGTWLWADADFELLWEGSVRICPVLC